MTLEGVVFVGVGGLRWGQLGRFAPSRHTFASLSVIGRGHGAENPTNQRGLRIFWVQLPDA